MEVIQLVYIKLELFRIQLKVMVETKDWHRSMQQILTILVNKLIILLPIDRGTGTFGTTKPVLGDMTLVQLTETEIEEVE